MNLPGVNTYVCDASATKDADAGGSQICPLPDGPRKSPNGTSLTSRDVRLESAKQANADIDQVAVANCDVMRIFPRE
jgi:hypothetical protein